MSDIFQVNTTKANVEKIARCMIIPVQSMWGYEVDEYTAKAYLDELYFFTEDALNLAMKRLRQESEKRPNIAKILKACYAARDSLKATVAAVEPENLTQAQIDSVMEGHVGRTAFDNGYWWELYEFLRFTAKSTFVSEEQLSKLKNEANAAWSDETMKAKVQQCEATFLAAFEKIAETIIARKQAVLYRYGRHA